MSKVVLEDTASGFAISTINNNFESIEDELNDKVLYRNNPTGEPNQMENLLDMNSFRIINLPAPESPNDAARLSDIPFDPIPIGTTTASLTSFIPTSTIASTNVQTAIEEVVSDNLATASSTQGAGGVGFLYSLGYTGNTVGKWLKDLATSAGSAFIGWIQAGTGAVLRTVSDKLREFVTPQDFGAVGNGSTDDTAALQTWLNNGGGSLVAGSTYQITGALTITVSGTKVWGSGTGVSQIRTTNATADIFTIGDSTTEISNLSFRDFTVWATTAKSAGYAFNNRLCTDSQWDNVNVGSNDLYNAAGGHRLFKGWYFDRFDTVSVYGGQCVTSSDGVAARGIVGDTYGAELVLDGNLRFFRQNTSGAAAVRIGGCCGVYLRRMDASLCAKGLIIDTTLVSGGTTATKRNREIFVEGANFDSCTSWGIHQVADSVAVLHMDKPWAAGSGASDGSSGGVLLEGGSTVQPYIDISNPNFYLNKGAGLRMDGAAFVSVDGGRISQNGASVTNGGHGIEWGTTMTTRFSITGTDINNNGIAAKGYGIEIPAALDNFNIDGVTLFSNAQGVISVGGGFGPTKLIRNCLGYVTENSGIATVADGNSSVVVAHGLSATPATVHLTPVGAPSVGTYSAGSIGATNFTIDNGAVAAGARQFSWRASVTGN